MYPPPACQGVLQLSLEYFCVLCFYIPISTHLFSRVYTYLSLFICFYMTVCFVCLSAYNLIVSVPLYNSTVSVNVYTRVVSGCLSVSALILHIWWEVSAGGVIPAPSQDSPNQPANGFLVHQYKTLQSYL